MRNTLTIAETKDILCAEHAARLFVAECWWAVIPNKEGSFAKDGNAQPFWALVNATLELGMPLGYEKVENHLRKLSNVPHSDPEKVLRSLIKAQPRAILPIMASIEARCKYIAKALGENHPSANAQAAYDLARAAYDAEVEAEHERINATIKDIMRQRPTSIEATPENHYGNDDEINEPKLTQNIFETATRLGAFNEETGEYDEYDVTFGEWEIPVDRIIEFGERQLKFLAANRNVPDIIFGTENALWEGELDVLKHIVQEQEHEGAGEQSRVIDEGMLDAAGMQAGSFSGK